LPWRWGIMGSRFGSSLHLQNPFQYCGWLGTTRSGLYRVIFRQKKNTLDLGLYSGWAWVHYHTNWILGKCLRKQGFDIPSCALPAPTPSWLLREWKTVFCLFLCLFVWLFCCYGSLNLQQTGGQESNRTLNWDSCCKTSPPTSSPGKWAWGRDCSVLTRTQHQKHPGVPFPSTGKSTTSFRSYLRLKIVLNIYLGHYKFSTKYG